jgi:hypothetical protein
LVVDLNEERSAQAADSWYAWELPVLLTLAEWDEGNLDAQYLDVVRLTELMGRPDTDQSRVGKAVRRLSDAGFLEVAFEGAGSPWDFMISRLTPSGLQACGAWPASGDLASAVVAALEAKAGDIQARDPEGASTIRAFARYLRDAGMDVAKAVATAVITQQLRG